MQAGKKSKSRSNRADFVLTEFQRRALELASRQGGRITSRDAIKHHLGPATCGLLANKGLLIDLGFSHGAQQYKLADEPTLGPG